MNKWDEDKIHKQIYEEVVNELAKENEKSNNECIIKILKYLLIFIAIIVIVLLVLAYISNGTSIDFLKSKIVSYKINSDNVIDVRNNHKIIFENNSNSSFNTNIYFELKSYYLLDQDKEFVVCLLGYTQDGNYKVTGFYIPDVYQQTVFSVTSRSCSNDTIIIMHSHPPNRCIFSDTDIESFKIFRQRNSDVIFGVMCDIDIFGFYGFND